MTVEVKETTLGRCVVARCDDRLVCVAVEDDDQWRIVAGSLPAIRVATFDDAVAWVDHLDAQAAHEAHGDVVAIRGGDIHFMLGTFRPFINDGVLPPLVRVWIDPLDQAVKFKAGNGTWSPPLGKVEATRVSNDAVERVRQIIKSAQHPGGPAGTDVIR